MTVLPPKRAAYWTRSRIAAAVALAACVAVFTAANAHLVVVSFRSQPDCVPHLKVPGEGAAYRAAESSC
jgi:hypothetical protein